MGHSCAVALLQAGTDITVIRDFLGHASIATTSRDMTPNLKIKRKVIEALWKRIGIAPEVSVEQTAYDSIRPATLTTRFDKVGKLTQKTAAH